MPALAEPLRVSPLIKVSHKIKIPKNIFFCIQEMYKSSLFDVEHTISKYFNLLRFKNLLKSVKMFLFSRKSPHPPAFWNQVSLQNLVVAGSVKHIFLIRWLLKKKIIHNLHDCCLSRPADGLP